MGFKEVQGRRKTSRSQRYEVKGEDRDDDVPEMTTTKLVASLDLLRLSSHHRMMFSHDKSLTMMRFRFSS